MKVFSVLNFSPLTLISAGVIVVLFKLVRTEVEVCCWRFVRVLRVDTDTLAAIEQLCVCIEYYNACNSTSINFYFFVSYIPPYSDNAIYLAHISNIRNIVNRLPDRSYTIVLGDFNLSNMKWIFSKEDKCMFAFNVNKNFEFDVIDNMYAMNFRQANVIYNSIGRILDLVFVDEELEAVVTEVDLPLLNNSIHHKALLVTFNMIVLNSFVFDICDDKPKFDFLRADYASLNNYFYLVDWDKILDCPSLDVAYTKFRNILESAISESVPVKRTVHSNKPIWFNRSLSRVKNALNKIYKKSATDNSLRGVLCQLRKEYEFLKKFVYRQYIFSLECKIKQNSKTFWTFINTKRKSIGIPSNMFYDNISSDDRKQICDMFASYFQSNFINEAITCNSALRANAITDLGLLQLTEDDILSELSSLDSSVSLAPDNFPPLLLKMCKLSLVKPLTIIFNMSMAQGEFLDCWKDSFITPIHKSGSKRSIANYRPIAKLQLIPKLFEAIVKKKIYAEVRNHISEFQHDFVSDR